MVVVAPSWNLDVAGAQRLEEAIEPLGAIVLVDLSDVAFVASSALGFSSSMRNWSVRYRAQRTVRTRCNLNQETS